MDDRASPSDKSPPAPQPAGLSPEFPHSHSQSFVMDSPGGSCIQEWTGSDWVVVEVTDCAQGFEAQALDPSRIRGTYVGERVVTACVKA
jgi:hypothetical protein